MNKGYKLQFEVSADLYDKWKDFLYDNGRKPYGKIIHLNAVAMETGIEFLMNNPKAFKEKTKEIEL
jgi:hypothetical protein